MRCALVPLCAIAPTATHGQDAADRAAVLKTVQTFFDTMTARGVPASSRSTGKTALYLSR
jgi:hypothetical protein